METPRPDPLDSRFADWLIDYEERRRSRSDRSLDERDQADAGRADADFGDRCRRTREVLGLLEMLWPREPPEPRVAPETSRAGGSPTPQLPSTIDDQPGRHEIEPEESPAPRLFGRYEVLHEVAQGGMGVVYRVRDGVLGRTVALKTLRTGLLARSGEIERFYDEARAVAGLAHPHIVPLYEIGEIEGLHYFTMAFAEGGSLAARVAELAGRPPREAVLLVEKIARAVHVAHQHKIIHRDLKPANILLDAKGEPWVSDFGLAKFLENDLERTVPGTPIGTAGYMAPEQVRGQTERYSAATDVWALGVILYELLTGTRPFPGATREEVQRAICQDDPIAPRRRRPALDKDLATIVQWCLEKEPANRCPSAEALADDLAAWREGKVVRARPRPWPHRAGRWLRRRVRWLAAGLGAVLIAALLLLAMRSEPAPVSPEQWSQQLASTLRQDNKITLLGATGAPRWHRWLVGAEVCKATVTPNQPWTVFAAGPALVELAPAIPVDRYRLRAEVLQEESPRGLPLGLYVGHARVATSQGDVDLFARWTFNQRAWVGQPQITKVYLDGGLWESVTGKTTHAFDSSIEGPSPGPQEKVWRRLELDVSPEKIVCQWEGQPLRELSWARLNKTLAENARIFSEFKTGLRHLKGLDFRLGPTSGVGLFVQDGTARFRNIVLESISLAP